MIHFHYFFKLSGKSSKQIEKYWVTLLHFNCFINIFAIQTYLKLINIMIEMSFCYIYDYFKQLF